MQAGWGDEGADVGPLNPHYDANAYQDYSQSARRNLARVDENRIDFDLLEELVGHIDASYDDGAVLVFLPGERRLAYARELRSSPMDATASFATRQIFVPPSLTPHFKIFGPIGTQNFWL